MTRIGYIRNAEKLKSGIIDGSINVIEDYQIFHQCYFCRKRIDQKKMLILRETETHNGFTIETDYFCDIACFAKIMEEGRMVS